MHRADDGLPRLSEVALDAAEADGGLSQLVSPAKRDRRGENRSHSGVLVYRSDTRLRTHREWKPWLDLPQDELTILPRHSKSGKPIVLHRQPSGCLTVVSHQPQGGGYVQVYVGKRQTLVHRYAFELRHGPIPAGKRVDHRCENKRCCNTDHMQLLTQPAHARVTMGRMRKIKRETGHWPRPQVKGEAPRKLSRREAALETIRRLGSATTRQCEQTYRPGLRPNTAHMSAVLVELARRNAVCVIGSVPYEGRGNMPAFLYALGPPSGPTP